MSGERISEIEALVQGLLCNLPEGCADINVLNDPNYGGCWLSIYPANSNSAPVKIGITDDAPGIDVVVGKTAVFELSPQGYRYADLPLHEEIKAICNAAFEGNFLERVWKIGDRIVRSEAEIRLNNELVTNRRRELVYNPLKRQKRVELRYEPYCATSIGSAPVKSPET